MVDEFQDTNGLQLSLIEQLRGPDTRLFLVGDEFQSIYGFRHADVEVYRREHRRFAGGGEPNGVALPLTGNFRAAPELVAATNAIGAALLDGFEPLTASVARTVDGGDPPVELLLTVDDRKAVGGRGDRSCRGPTMTRARAPRSRRRAGWRHACASWSTRARTRPRSSSCCAPSPTSRRSSGPSRTPGSTPTWSAAAASGPSSRSRTCAACWRWSPTRSTTRRCSALSPRPPARPPRHPLAAAARGTAPRRERARRPPSRLAAGPRPGRGASAAGGDPEAAADPRRGARAPSRVRHHARASCASAGPRAASRRWSIGSPPRSATTWRRWRARTAPPAGRTPES